MGQATFGEKNCKKIECHFSLFLQDLQEELRIVIGFDHLIASNHGGFGNIYHGYQREMYH